ncbi:unnamed protein product [Miscanthus lutarioriparius]|uniref:Uncharacterized protein n=1 Tax=Miscanthus lutarioriparius TaxID=422564 RepID=A0A811MNS7_9POAL|nr:unnamed protein product [Miscanthus lutarioriparius]
MELHGFPSAGRSDDLAKKLAEAELTKKLAEAGFSEEQLEREYFARLIEEMEEEWEYGIITKEMPRPTIVKYHDMLEKIWGWDKLLPKGISVSWSDYSTYLKEYHHHNVHAVTKDSSVAALAETCLNNEEQLVSELKIQVKPEEERLLQMRKSRILSCLIHKRACSVIHTAGSDVCGAALLGMAKEAEMLCMWMRKNNKLVDFYDDPVPDQIGDSPLARYKTLDFVVDILEKSSAAGRSGPGGDGDGVAADGAANTTGGSVSDVLNSQYKKPISGGEKSNKRKSKEEDLLDKIWGWEGLVPLHSDIKWYDDCSSHLEEYYKRNAYDFIAPACQNQQIASSAICKSCLKIEEELLSMWKTSPVWCTLDDANAVSTVIESTLIKERALSIGSTGVELSVPSTIAFLCITMEADLMCELLKQGAEHYDDIIQLSSVIRMCALGLVDLTGNQSMVSAAAMMAMASEAKKMCDWMKRENQLVTISLSESHELKRGSLIRGKALDVMTSILHDSFLPKVHILVMLDTMLSAM